MNTKTTRSIAMLWSFVALVAVPAVSFAATLYKADTTTLANAADWTNNVAPTTADTCSYYTGATITLANSINQTLGGDLSIGNLITSQSTRPPILIKADGYTLTLNVNNAPGDVNGVTCAIIQEGTDTDMTMINCPISLGGNAIFRVSKGGMLSLNGAIGDGGGGKSLTLTAATSNGKPGYTTLSAANSYSGGTYVGLASSGGTLVILSGSATLGASGSALTLPVASTSGNILDLGGTSQTLGAVDFGKDCTVQNGSISGTSFSGSGLITANLSGAGLYTLNATGKTLIFSGNNTYSGGTTITLGTLLVTQPAALPLSGAISLAGSSSAILAICAGGAGEWGASDLTSLLTYGSLTVGANGTLGVDTTGGDFSYSSAIAGPSPANLALTKLGPNTLTLSGANTYQKVTTINAGTLKVDNTAGGSLYSTPLTFTGTGKFTYNTASTAQSLGALTLSGGEGTVQFNRTADTTLTFASLAARTAGKTANLTLSGGTPSTSNGIKFTTASAGFMNQGVFYNGSDYAVMDGANTFVRSPVYGTDSGFTTADNITPSTHTLLTSTPAAQSTVTLNTLKLSGSGVGFSLNTSSDVLTLANGGLIKTGGGSAGTISSGFIQTTDSLRDLVVRTDSSSDELTVSSVLGAAVPPQSATCTIGSSVITGLSSTSNMYVGMRVLVQSRSSFGLNTPSTTITTIDSSSQITVNNNFNLTTGSYTLYFGGNSLTKSGAGTLTLSGENNLLNVNLNGGQLNINSTNALGCGTWPTVTGNQSTPGTLTINEGTTIDNTSGASLTTANYNVAFNGSFTFVGSDDLWLSLLGALTIPNDITLTTSTLDKTLKCGSGLGQTMARLTKRGPGTLQFDANGSQPFMGGLNIYEGVYASPLTQAYWQNVSAGPIALGDPATGNSRNAIINICKGSTHIAPITVQAGSSGTLAILGEGSPIWQGPLVLNNNVTLTAPNGTFHYLGFISGAGNLNIGVPSGGLASITVFGLSKNLSNAGTVKLYNQNTFTGNTVINSGTLLLYNALALQNSILDTETSIANKLTLGGTATYALTLGGLSGSKDLDVTAGSMFATFSSGYTNVTALTLNPGAGATNSYFGVIANGASGMTLTKTGAGTQILSGTNTYTGSTTITDGTLALGASGVLPASAVYIGGGTLDAATFTNTVGTLEITGSATINLGDGGTLAFANSSGLTWADTLNITGSFVSRASLRFGTDSGGLTPTQLASITSAGYRSFSLNASGYLKGASTAGSVIIVR